MSNFPVYANLLAVNRKQRVNDTSLKVSIVTVAYNSAATIRDTLESVLSQDYGNVEYIVVDGKSSDNTLEIIQEYADRIDLIVSEKDKGMYDALNKGIRLATGDVVGMLHADDVFYSKDVISKVAEKLAVTGAETLYGDLVFVDQYHMDRVIRKWRSGEFQKGSFINGWMPPHTTFFAKKTCFEDYGFYDTDFRTAADYELMLRFLEKHNVSTCYLPEKMVMMRAGGMSNESVENRLKANNEDRRAWTKNGMEPKFYTRFLKPARKIHQFTFEYYGYKLLLPLLIIFGLLSGAVLNINDNLMQLPIKVILSGFLAFGITILAIPPIINIARIKKLTDQPNNRSSHQVPTPTMGGIAVFAATILGSNLLIESNLVDFKGITAACMVIFFMGVKDDIFALAPRKKILAQLLAAVLIVMSADIRINHFFGFLGFHEIPEIASVIFTIFVIVSITNAFNLIDGIDGLAGSLGIVASATFGVWFSLVQQYDYAILAFTLAGALVGFLKFNFSTKRKIFLGDTGSMILGFMLAILAIKFIDVNMVNPTRAATPHAPLVAFTILAIPLLDMLRVFMIRLQNGKSPFHPDKNHIHHLLIDRNPSHQRATIFLALMNVLLVIFAFTIAYTLDMNTYSLILVFAFLLYFQLARKIEASPKGMYKLFFERNMPFMVKYLWAKSNNNG